MKGREREERRVKYEAEEDRYLTTHHVRHDFRLDSPTAFST